MHAFIACFACMLRNRTQYTLRQVPPQVDAALRQAARARHASLNQMALEVLARGLGVGSDAPVYTDLDDLAGRWEEDPALTEAIDSQDQVDSELWS